MNRKNIIITIVLIIGFVIARDVFWNIRAKTTWNDEIEIKLKYSPQFLVIMDPVVTKHIELTNLNTSESVEMEFESIEWELLFFIQDNELRIADRYLGESRFNLKTMKLAEGSINCLTEANHYCGGFSEKGWQEIGTADIKFNGERFE